MKKIILGLAIVSALNIPTWVQATTAETRPDSAFPEPEFDLREVGGVTSRSPASESDVRSAINSDIQGGYSTRPPSTPEYEKSKVMSEIESVIREMKSTERNIDSLENQIMMANKRDDSYMVRRLRGEIIKRRIERKGFTEDIRALRQRLNQLGG